MESCWQERLCHCYQGLRFFRAERFAWQPAKVIWLRIGNCTTVRAGFLLRDAFPKIQDFLNADEENCLVLSLQFERPKSRI